MQRLQTAAESISRVGAVVGGAMLLIASILICIDITLRYTLAVTLGGADELSGYALAISSAWGFSAALLSRSHIRIDTVYVRIKSITVRALLDLISLATLLFFFGMVTFYAWGVVRQSWVSESHSLSAIEAPLIVPQGLWFAGLVFFVLVCLLLLARGLLAFAQGRYGELFKLIGSKSAVEEAEEEIAATHHGLEQEKPQ
ncbi:MAG: TRAP transporter small permease [Reyranella sp.]|uniref:TRAP transporter small permease subunit n=1 Tax=Reyranella sp. TaxID=1929291 RepID=UPI001AD3DB00|nr:TRAP transporter small permease [Reyranella sp.]MBN9090653.1 TRAP transporter small permease [Reyranella sp.]